MKRKTKNQMKKTNEKKETMSVWKNRLLLMIVCSIFLFSGIAAVCGSSEYTEIYDLNNDWIDGIRDSKYELLYNSSSEQIWFAYSTTRYAFYIESNTTLLSVSLNSTLISGNVSSGNVISIFNGNHSEIVISRAYFGNKVAFSIQVNNGKKIFLNPLDAFAPVTTDTTTDISITNSSTTNNTNATSGGVDLVWFVKYVLLNPVMGLVIGIILIILADYTNHPIVVMQDENGKTDVLGRFLYEEDDTILHKKKFYLMGPSGVRIYYCKESFRSLDKFIFMKVLVITWLYPHVIHTKLDIPEGQKFTQKTPVITRKNKISWILFKILSITPFRHLASAIYKSLKYTETELKSVDYLLPFINMDAIEYRFDLTYKELVHDPVTNTESWVDRTDENVTAATYLTLTKTSKIKDVKAVLKNIERIVYPTVKEAEKDKQSRREIINSYENQNLALEIDISHLQIELQNSYKTISQQKLMMEEKVRDALKPMEELNEYLQRNFANMLSRTLQLRALGFSEFQAIQRTLKEEVDRIDTEKANLRVENLSLKQKVNELNNFRKEDSFKTTTINLLDTEKSDVNG